MTRPPKSLTLETIHSIYQGPSLGKPSEKAVYVPIGHMRRDPGHPGTPPPRPLPPNSRRPR